MIQRPTPAWFDEAKFGIFVHWVPAAVPAFAEIREPDIGHANPDWERLFHDNPYAEFYWNSMSIPNTATQRHHEETYGDLPYEAFVKQFRDGLVAWDPEAWADLFQASGARYVVLVTKHLDGFALWPTEHPNPRRPGWHSERDVVGELAAAVRARGLRFGVYYSAGVDWTFGGLPISDEASLRRATPQSGEYAAYVDAHWHELIERYRPSILWNDMGYPAQGDVGGVFEHFLSAVPDGVVNDRFDFVRQPTGELLRDFVTPEYSVVAPAVGTKWEACRGMGTSFGYNRVETDATYTPAGDLLRSLVDVVARGGNLLLNVGPTGAGAIPWPQANRLLAIGWWLRQNEAAIFRTRPWGPDEARTAEGLPLRCTQSDDAVHAMVLGAAPAHLDLPLELASDVTVALGDHGERLPWSATGQGVRVELPEPADERPVTHLRLCPAGSVRAR